MLEESMILGRQHCVDEQGRGVREPQRAVVLSSPIVTARQHFGFECNRPDVVAMRHPGDAVVIDVDADASTAQSTIRFLTAQDEVPAGGRAPELARGRWRGACLRVAQARESPGEIDQPDVDTRGEVLSGRKDEGGASLLGAREAG